MNLKWGKLADSEGGMPVAHPAHARDMPGARLADAAGCLVQAAK